ncbi:TPA: hypothetical protein ACFNMH_000469 [Neisseria elongata]
MIGRLKGKLGVITKSFAFMADILTFDMGRLEKISNAVRWPNAVKNLLLDDIWEEGKAWSAGNGVFAVSLSKSSRMKLAA